MKVKIEVGEEFPVGQFGFFDPPFGPPLRPVIVFQAEQALEKFGNRGGLGGGSAKFIVEDGGNPLQAQFETCRSLISTSYAPYIRSGLPLLPPILNFEPCTPPGSPQISYDLARLGPE